jgi:uncharacterized protein (DUF885 family)
MKNLSAIFLVLVFLVCPDLQAQTTEKKNNKELGKLFASFSEEESRLFPFQATIRGDNRYNDLYPAVFTDSYQDKLKTFYTQYLTALSKFKRAGLSENDRLSYDIFKWRLEMSVEGLMQKDNRLPFDQAFASASLQFAQLGSGAVVQPFKTVNDYHNWIRRATAFSAWADSAIVYFRKGMAEGIVLPQILVTKMIPQMVSFVTDDATKSVFYGPITNLPKDFSTSEKEQLTTFYVKLINEQLVPAYKRLHAFLQNEYLPKARTTSGLSALPGGAAWYNYRIRLMTTTNKTADEVYSTGLGEVKRIRAEMEKVKNTVGFKGDLKAFFEHLRTEPKFFPYKTPEEVLAAYRAIQQKIDPNLPKMFRQTPKTPFEIRQTEAFRAASAAAQYVPGLTDGSRPGIFYVPIVDATKTSYARESLFIHEAVPGHHYQAMLQRENESLPSFRRHGSYSAYQEAWGLYSESLGKELGLYTDPYQRMAALGDEIFRAIRLVVDPSLHVKGWTREKAIDYMLENAPLSEQFVTAEIERYMAMPGQALAYKVGELKLQELRKRYVKQLGGAFNLAAFHEEVLKDGAMPLDILERKMDEWARRQKN